MILSTHPNGQLLETSPWQMKNLRFREAHVQSHRKQATELGVDPGPSDSSRGLHLQATPTRESMQCLYKAGPQEESHSSHPLIIIFDSGNTWYFLSASTGQHVTSSKSKGNRTVIFISNIWYICSSRRKAWRWVNLEQLVYTSACCPNTHLMEMLLPYDA